MDRYSFKIMWHDAWKPEYWSQSRRWLLGKGWLNTFPRQGILKQQSKYFWAITMETVFTLGTAPMLYNEDPRPAE
jgi:hypothetical protein